MRTPEEIQRKFDVEFTWSKYQTTKVYSRTDYFTEECRTAGASHVLLKAAGHSHCWRCSQDFKYKAGSTYYDPDVVKKLLAGMV